MRDIVNLLATSLPLHCHLTFLARKLTVLANDVVHTGHSRGARRRCECAKRCIESYVEYVGWRSRCNSQAVA